MKTTTTRPMSTEERTALEGHLNPAPAGSPSRVMGLFMGVPIGFTALIVLNLALPGPAFLRVLLAVAVGAGAAWLFGRWMAQRHREMFRPVPEVEDVLRRDLADGQVEVRRYEAEAVVKATADRSRFVSATYFVKLADGSVALLVGPHLEEAEFRGEFPATAFEIASGASSHYVLSVKKTGDRLAPVKTRAPLSDAEWEEIGDDDDESVPLGWAEIVERADRNPLTRETLQKQAEERAAVDKELDEILAAQTPPPADPIRPK
ncbi:MAG: hypothetical protein IPN03_07480 [Holophagales bacterium]|nr:hypothetical protein [Holophagales bacterium]